jgi:hypothetical protein
MPTSYRIDVRAGLVFSVLEGHITNEDLLDHQQRISADPDFTPTMNHVIDTRGITDVSVTALGLHLLTTRSNLGPGARRALIEGNASSSYVRMFQTLRSQTGADTKIFSTVEAAYRWLGLDHGAEPGNGNADAPARE